MNAHPILKRLLEAIALSAFAGGIAYGLTVWLAPPSISAHHVAMLVAAITALAVLAPTVVLSAAGRRKASPWSTPESYYDTTFSIHKDEGWND